MNERNKKNTTPRITRRRPKSGTRLRASVSVYLLWHTDRTGDEKLIGVYEKRSNASSAMKRIKGKPGFVEKGGVFEIVSYELNKDHWSEGFIHHEGFSLPAWFHPA
jgi:hypothetical protein